MRAKIIARLVTIRNALQENIIIRIRDITLGDVLPLFDRATAYQEHVNKHVNQQGNEIYITLSEGKKVGCFWSFFLDWHEP